MVMVSQERRSEQKPGNAGASSSDLRPARPPRDAHVRVRWLLLALMLLAAAVRVYWGLMPRIVWGDEPFYLWLGQSLLNGEGYQFFGISGIHLSPLFPLLAGFVAKISATVAGNSPQALAAGSVVLYVICGTVLLLPIYAIARRTTGRESVGLCAALVTALYPTLTVRVPLWGTMTEPLYLLLVATAWWGLLVAQQDRRLWAYAAAGASLGLAYLTRNEAIVYLVAGLAAMFIIELVAPGPRASPHRHAGSEVVLSSESIFRSAGIKRALVGTALAIGVFALLISPYLVILHAETGKWQVLEEAGSTYVSAQGLASKDLAAFDKATWGLDTAGGEVYLFSPVSEGQGLLSAITADPRTFLRLLRLNLTDLVVTTFSSQLIPLMFAGLALLGLFARAWNTRRLRAELLLMASLAGPLSFLLFFIQPRYLAGVLIPALVWIGGGSAWLGDWLAQTWAQLRMEGRTGGRGTGGCISLSAAARTAGIAARNLAFVADAAHLGAATDGKQFPAGASCRGGRAGCGWRDAGYARAEPVSGHCLPRRHALGADPGCFLARGRGLCAPQGGRFPGAGCDRG